ncbi:hypothetical protein [Streptomyces sp. NPDC005281]|uniref:hypothetical protein n=1 Tax=Streptomyces sp. NPDC005281 TaxID=3155712 RepID=UPI0033B3DBC8
MRRDVRLQIITEAIERLIPGAIPARISVQVVEDVRTGSQNTWSGDADALAAAVFTALFGRPRPIEDSPLARADAAKGTGDLVGELAPLLDGDQQLTSAPWYPARPGDLVHVCYERTDGLEAFGETYIVGDVGDGLMNMQLLSHSLPADMAEDAVEKLAGWFTTEASDDPLYEAWFAAGSERLTVVRDGRPVHVGRAQ